MSTSPLSRTLRWCCHRTVHRALCTSSLTPPLPPAKQDKFGGLTLDIAQLARDKHCHTCPQKFDEQLKGWLRHWRQEGVKAAWLQIPLQLGSHMAVAGQHGFTFHHAEGNQSMLVQWLLDGQRSGLPRYATHQVGCSGCVVREDTKQVLVVRDRYNPFSLWKFPGGLSELAEDIEDTAVREVYEETGVKTEFCGIMMLRQQHLLPGAFGRSDLFYVCHLTPLTFDLYPDASEITHCQWIGLDELEASAQKSAITLRAVNMVRIGLERGFDKVAMVSETCKSVYKGLTFRVHNPRVDGLKVEEENYLHSLGDEKALTDVKK